MPTTTVTTRRVRPDFVRGLVSGLGAGVIAAAWLLIYGVVSRHSEAALYVLGMWLILGLLWAAVWPVARKRGLALPALVISVVAAVAEGALLRSQWDERTVGALIFTGLFVFIWFVRQYRGR